VIRRESPGNNVEAKDLGGDNTGPLFLNFGIWIRDDGWFCSKQNIPDKSNDEIQSSSKKEIRRKPIKSLKRLTGFVYLNESRLFNY
jgi:hypothetical protein